MELVHVTATTQELQQTAIMLSEKLAQPFYTDERKKGISQYLGYLFFELNARQGQYLNAEQKSKIDEFNEAKGYMVE